MNVVGVPSSLKRLSTTTISSSLSSSSSNTFNNAPPNLYDETPNFELSLDEFEMYALKRLKVLRTLERLRNFRGVDAATFEAKLSKVLDEEKLSNKSMTSTAAANDTVIDIDVASHFILRLSYCRTEELRAWFKLYECDLFRYRLKQFLKSNKTNNNTKAIKNLVKEYADVEPLTKEQKEQIRKQLLQTSMLDAEITSQTIYSVPFTQVLNLVAARSCYMKSGQVYVPESKIIEILVSKFRTNLSRELTRMAKHTEINAFMESSSSSHHNATTTSAESVRIFPLIQNLDKVLVSPEQEYNDDNGLGGDLQLTSNTVGSLVPHMPLCMRVLHNGMLKDKKLKYHGRLQYSLFLKGAGLSLDDALIFFQRHFAAITADEYQKQYAYSLRHIYGREGKRENKSAYNCSKIIIGSPAPVGMDQHHGCPYKHYDDDHVNHLLQQLRIGTNNAERNEIIQLKKSHQYQLACQKHFEIQHPNISTMNGPNGTGIITLDNVGNHPNAWFRASLEYQHYNNDTGSGSSTSRRSNDGVGVNINNTSTPPKSNNTSMMNHDDEVDELDDDIIMMMIDNSNNDDDSTSVNNNNALGNNKKRTSAEVSP